jgi:hypothetical protein
VSDAACHGDANHRDSHPDPLRALAQNEIDPKKSDQDGRLREAVVAGIKRLGLMGMQTPREYGGLDLDMTSYARVMQDVATYDPSVAVFLGAHQSIGMKALLLFGTAEQKSKYLPGLAAGEQIAAFAKLKCLRNGEEKERVTAFIVEKAMGFRAGPLTRRWGNGAPTSPRFTSTTCGSLRRTCWARPETASRSRWRS